MPTTWLDTFTKQARRFGTFPYPHRIAFLLNLPVRRLVADPVRLVDSLELNGGERVLELGPGPGFFSVEVAHRLTTGQLELFDIQPEMLDKARRKLDRAACHNASFRSGDASEGLPYPDTSLDVAFVVQTLGEVPDKYACLRELHRVLTPDGRLVIQEGFPDPDRLSVAETRQIAETAGFAFCDVIETRWDDIVRFTPSRQ